MGQVVLGIVVGCMMYFHPDITIKEKTEIAQYSQQHNLQDKSQYEQAKVEFQQESSRSTKTTIPFVKNNEFDYSWLIKWAGDNYKDYAWIIFIPIVIFFIKLNLYFTLYFKVCKGKNIYAFLFFFCFTYFSRPNTRSRSALAVR